jgi:hypothetical protein
MRRTVAANIVTLQCQDKSRKIGVINSSRKTQHRFDIRHGKSMQGIVEQPKPLRSPPMIRYEFTFMKEDSLFDNPCGDKDLRRIYKICATEREATECAEKACKEGEVFYITRARMD